MATRKERRIEAQANRKRPPGRPLVAIVFLALVGFLLYIPIRDAMDEGSADSKGGTGASKAAAEGAGFEGEYPSGCLDPASEPTESLVAYVHKNGIGVTEVPGETRVVIDDTVPFKWSPTGTYLAAGSGTVYDSNGDEVESLFDDGEAHAWAWSPIADCAVVADAKGALQVFVPDEGEPQPLIDQPTSGFAFSPAGGDLAYLVAKDDVIELWVASLANESAARIASLDPAEGDVILAGWTPNASHVLFWQGSGDELTVTGTKLQAATKGEVVELKNVLAHRDFLDACKNKLVGIVGKGARAEENKKVLAYLEPDEEAEILTPDGSYDMSPRCEPDGTEIAVVRSDSPVGDAPRALVLLDKAGSPVQEPTSDPNYDDAYPMWGRGDTGILFVRDPAEGGRPELWHLVPDETPEATEAVMDKIDGDPEYTREGWGHWIDWNADVPAGTSVVSAPQ